jgi:UDP-hydrolysing UDP-N-acetyl-D-glucosamine 2-epimerase
MSTKRKIAVCVMSRANFGRLKSVIKNIVDHDELELQLILGASFYNEEVEFPVASRIQCLLNSDDHAGMVITTGLLLTQITQEFQRLNPDIVLVHGDRYEVLACATAAAYMNIALAHTEGGEETGCIDDKVRHAITALADIHFPVTNRAASSLFDYDYEHELPKVGIFVVGSPALDIVKQSKLKMENKKDYILVLHHPNTTEEESIEPLVEALSEIDMHKIWVNPNVDAGNKKILKKIHSQNVEFKKNLPPEEYYKLLANCKCAVGNSSSFIKEGSFLGTPAVLIGNRQQDRETGFNVEVFIKNDKESIKLAIEKQIDTGSMIAPSNKFGDGESGKKIANILAEV